MQGKKQTKPEPREEKKGRDRMYRGGFNRLLLVLLLVPFMARAQVTIDDARIVLDSGQTLEAAIAAGALGGTPLCTAAQLAAESCGGTTADSLAIVTNGGRDSITANTCETSTPTPTRSFVCQRDSGGVWRPRRSGNGTLTIAASNAQAFEIASADIRCGAARCDQEIQAAINTMQARIGSGDEGGGAIHLSAGQFEVQATIILGGDSAGNFQRVNLFGAGPEMTTIKQVSGSPITIIKYQGNAANRDTLFYTFRDLSVDGRNLYGAGNDGAHCVDMLGDQAAPPDGEEAWDVHIYNVFFSGCGGAGYRGYGWGLIIQDSVIEFNGIGVRIVWGADAKMMNNKISANGINIYFDTDTDNGVWGGVPIRGRIVGNIIGSADPSTIPSGMTSDGIRLSGYQHQVVGNMIYQDSYTGSRDLVRLEDATENMIAQNVMSQTVAISGAGITLDSASAYNLLSDNLFAMSSAPQVTSSANQNVSSLKLPTDGLLSLFTDSASGLRIVQNDGDASATTFGTILRGAAASLLTANQTILLPANSAAENQVMLYDAALGRLRQHTPIRRAVNLVRDPLCLGLYARTAAAGVNECESGVDNGTLTGAATIAQFAAESVPVGTPTTHYRIDNDGTAGGLRIGNVGSQPTRFEVQPLSIGGWYYMDDETPAFQYLFYHDTGSGYRSYTDVSTDTVYAEVGATPATETSTAQLTAVAWHHVVVAYDNADDTLKVYIDGIMRCNGVCGVAANQGVTSNIGLFWTGDGTTAQSLDGRGYEQFAINRMLSQEEICAIARCGFSDDIADRLLACDMGGIVCSN